MDNIVESAVENTLEELNGDYIEHLMFNLGKEVYGIPVENVREVIEYNEVFDVPDVPEYIAGVLNLRGTVVTVIDLSHRFYGVKSEITKLSCIVIVEVFDGDGMILIGVIIDSIRSVINISESSMKETPSFGSKIDVKYISGVGKVGDEFVILLNVDSVLKIEDLANF